MKSFKAFILLFSVWALPSLGMAQVETLKQKYEKIIKPGDSYSKIISKCDKEWKRINQQSQVSDSDKKTHKKYLRWKNFWENRLDENGGFEGLSRTELAYRKKQFVSHGNDKRSISEVWTPIGPYGIDVSGNELMMGSNRGGIGAIHAVAYDPVDEDIMYAASSMGGLFKTTNGGAYWSNISDNYYNIYGGFKDIVVDPNNSNTIYATLSGGNSLGWAMKRDYYGYGAIMSSDGGISWSALNGSGSSHNYESDPTNGGNGRFIEDFLLHPTNGKMYMLVSENANSSSPDQTHILEANAGSNQWTLIQTFVGRMRNFALLPSNNNIFYISGISGFYKYNKSTNTQTALFHSLDITIPLINVSEAYICTSNAAPNKIFILARNPENPGWNYCHAYFTTYDNSTGVFSSPTLVDTHFLTSGGVSTITVSNVNASHIYLGKGNLYHSINGGITFDQITADNSGVGTSNTLHTDFNDYAFSPAHDKLIIGNDGGLLLRNIVTDNNKYISGCGLLISKAYSLWLDERYERSFLIGLQDNNSAHLKPNGLWQTIGYGDGGMSMISPSGGMSYAHQYNKGFTVNGAYSSPNTYASTNAQRRFHPYFTEEEVYGVITSGGGRDTGRLEIFHDNHTLGTSTGEKYSPSYLDLKFKAFDICEVDTSTCYAVATYNNSSTQKWMLRATQGQSTDKNNWPSVPITVCTNNPYAQVTRVLAHPLDPSQVWITFGGYHQGQKVFYSGDFGYTWEDHTSNLPDFPVNSIVMDKNSGYIFIGTDLGVFYKHSTSGQFGNWTEYGSGLPRVPISEIRINHTYNKIVAATFGRGVWEAPLECFNGTTNLPVSFKNYYNDRNINGSVSQNNMKSSVLRANNKISFTPGFVSAPTGYNFLSAKIIPCQPNGDSDPCSIYNQYMESLRNEREKVNNFKESINVFPNPTEGVITVQWETTEAPVDITVINTVGKVIFQQHITTQEQFKFNLDDQAKGIYFIKVSIGDKTSVEKIVYQ